MRRWVAAELWRAFLHWHSSASLVAFARTVAQRLQNRCCFKAIRRWLAQAELHQSVRNIFLLLQKRLCWVALNRWIEVAQIHQQNLNSLQKIVRRWTSLALYGAFSRWCLFAIESRQMRKIMSKVAKLWTRQEMAKVFRTMVYRLHQKKMITSTLSKLRNRNRLMSFNAWSIATEDKAADKSGHGKRLGKGQGDRTMDKTQVSG